MEPMTPMAPMQPLEGSAAWWPQDLGQPSSSGSQGGTSYAFFPDSQRLVVEVNGRRQVYESGSFRIGGVSQASGKDQALVFTSDQGDVDLDQLTRAD